MYWTLVKYCFRVFSLPYRGMLVTIVSVCLMYVDNFTLSTSQRAQDVVLRVFHIWRTQTARREVIYVSPFRKSAAKLEKKIPLWLCLHQQVVGHCRSGLQHWQQQCSGPVIHAKIGVDALLWTGSTLTQGNELLLAAGTHLVHILWFNPTIQEHSLPPLRPLMIWAYRFASLLISFTPSTQSWVELK